MKKAIAVIIVTLILAMMLPINAFAASGTVNVTITVKANPTAGLGSDLKLTVSSNKAIVYLPGSADASKLYLSWTDGITCKIGNTSCTSGSTAIPAVGVSTAYTFKKNTTTQSITITTMKSSEGVEAMFLNINESLGTISKMNSDSTHETPCYGGVVFDGASYQMKIKGRGNSTWTYGKKKPYNITLLADGTYTTAEEYEAAESQKAELIEGVSTKKWSLLANCADGSLLRNKVGYDLAYELGIGVESRYVDLYFNGEYKGNYLMTPKTDYKSSKNGYILELDNKEVADETQFRLTGLNATSDSKNLITVKDVGKKCTSTTEEIQSYMQTVLNAILDTKTENYLNYIDLDSFAKMYLLHEFYKSYDVISGSMFMHRDGTTADDKLYAGPIWDLDNTMGRSQTSGGCGISTDIQRNAESWYFDSISASVTSFFRFLGKHESFMTRVYEIYNEYKYAFEATKTNLDTQAEFIKASADMNFKCWDINNLGYNVTQITTTNGTSYGTGNYAVNYVKTTDWSKYVQNFKTYVTKRTLFFSDKLTLPDISGSIKGSTSYKENETVSLTASPNGTPSNLKYQWQASSDGKTFNNVSGATSAVYTATATDDMNGTSVRCLVSGNGISVNTNTVASVTLKNEKVYAPVTLSVEHVHGNYTTEVVKPTPESAGYTRHTCGGCTYYYDDTPTDKLELKFKNVSVGLDSSLSMYFKVSSDLFADNGFKNPYVEFTMGTETTTVSDYTVDTEKGLYIFELEDIAPNQAVNNVHAVVHAEYNSKDYSAELDMSVADYCYKALDTYGKNDAYATIRTLLVDLLNYASAVQTYSGYKTTELANAKLTDTQKGFATKNDPVIGDIFNKNYSVNNSATVAITGLGIVLDKNVTMRFKFKSNSALTGGYVKFTTAHGSSTVAFSKFEEIGTNTYYVYFDELNSAQMRDYVDIVVYDANDKAISNTIRSSIESYVYRANTNDLITVTKAMMKYGDSTKKYADEFLK